MYNRLIIKHLLLYSVLVVAGCSHSAIAPETENAEIPENWARGGDVGEVDLNWLEEFDDSALTSLVTEAVGSNYQLKEEQARLYQAEQTVVATRANRFPNLSASFNASRRFSQLAAGINALPESFGLAVNARWDADLWGRLNKEQQAAQLTFEAQRARLESVERNLAAATTGAYFDVIEAKQLLEVAVRRLDIAEESMDIVSSGYRQGLNDALDLYQARSEVEREQAGYAQQEQTYAEAVTTLQLGLARYPDGRLTLDGELPVISAPIPAGLPSELLTRRADLQESWLNLLAADATLAATHKARFPSLSLSGNYGFTTREFSTLLDRDNRVWTLASGLTQPLFNAGQLKAFEEQARARVQQAEQQYLALLYSAFADVENAISRAGSLQQRYESFLDAETNSAAALELALEQYQRGLVSYTTVLVSQRQAFDAEATVVQLRNQLLQNRIDLFLSLGGEFSTDL
ncbi:MAG: efflux transporter outer membrane subunit [Woeseiaceae bacterium]